MKKFRLHLLLIFSVISMATLLTSCVDDDEPANYGYLDGYWVCQEDPTTSIDFYRDGSGVFYDDYTGAEIDFYYTSYGDNLTFQWFPYNGPSYYEYCSLYIIGPDVMQIWYPARDGYPSTTLTYARR